MPIACACEVFALIDGRKNTTDQCKLQRVKTILGTSRSRMKQPTASCTRAQSLTRTCPCATCNWLLHPATMFPLKVNTVLSTMFPLMVEYSFFNHVPTEGEYSIFNHIPTEGEYSIVNHQSTHWLANNCSASRKPAGTKLYSPYSPWRISYTYIHKTCIYIQSPFTLS